MKSIHTTTRITTRAVTRVAALAATALLAATFSLPALALYQWLDDAGRKVFSDQPPPANIPVKRILQQPGKAAASSGSAAQTKAEIDLNDPKERAKAAAAEAAGKATESVKKSADKDNLKDKAKDKDLEAAKKKLDDEEAAKKKAEQDKVDAAKADNCKRAKQAKATFDSGVRLAHTNAKGERGIMDEATRMVETKRVEGIIASDCK